MYKPSMFNFILEDGEEMILYNAMSGLPTACRIRKNHVSIVKDVLLKSDILIKPDESNSIISTLIQKGFLVASDLDEKQKREALFTEINSGSMLRLIVLPTEQCNYRCKYCYESFRRGKMLPETQEAVIKFVQKNIQRFSGIRLSWFGGEPLLAMDIIESMSMRLMEICKKAKRKYISDITTNGYLLSQDTFRKLLDLNVIEYQITIDGTKEIHDAKKPLINGNGTFDVVTNNIRESIQDYLRSDATKNWYMSYAMWDSNETQNRCFGMQCYNAVFKHLEKAKEGKNDMSSLRAFHLECEHKKIMGLRLKWLNKNYSLDGSYLMQYKKIEEMADIALMLYLKFKATYNLDIIKRINEIYMRIIEKEEQILGKLLCEL